MINNKYKVGDVVIAEVINDDTNAKVVIEAPIVDMYEGQYVLDYNLENYYLDDENIIKLAPNKENSRFYPDDKLLFQSKDGQELIVNFRGYTNFTAMDKAIVVMPNGMQMQVDTSQLSRNSEYFANGGKLKEGDKFGDYSVTAYVPISYDNVGGSFGGLVKLVNQEDFDTIFIQYDNALRGGEWFVSKNGIRYIGKNPQEVITKLNLKKIVEIVPQEILIEKSNDMSNENIDITENDVDILESQPIQEQQVNSTWMINDNWYEQHPDKVLGQSYEASGKFGKVTKYRGDIDVLELIEVDLSFIGADKVLINPLASVSYNFNASAEILKPEVAQHIINVIEDANASFREVKLVTDISGSKTKEKVRKSSKIGFTKLVPYVVDETIPLNSFYDTFYALNSYYYTKDSPLFAENKETVRGELRISLEEVEVFTWYKSSIGQPLSKYYVTLFDKNRFSESENLRETFIYTVPESKVNDWVNDGLLFKFKNSLLPKYEYQSGNMYDKKLELTADKENIIALYGEEVYNNQEIVLQEAYLEVYNNRLLLNGGERSLKILPISMLAKSFKVKEIDDNPIEKGWNIKQVTAQSSNDYGKLDLIGDLRAKSYQKKKYDEISLQDAFSWWILNKTPLLKESISQQDIYKYYIQGKQFTSDKKLDKSEAEKQKSKIRAATQSEGERLFEDFLNTQLTNNDKIRLETTFNSEVNNYLPIKLDKVPVAFTMCKYYKGELETVRSEKREAVAFTMTNGTSVLSYDVGVGKTPSAIFTISAFIDAGLCKFPCVVVPNQVYRQFINEIKIFTPHLPIVEGYNMSPKYIANFVDENGENVKQKNPSICVMTYEGFESIGFNADTKEFLKDDLSIILSQGKNPKETATLQTKIDEMLGSTVKKTRYNIEDLGFDFMCYDEAHKMKKVFTSVVGIETNSNGEKVEVQSNYKTSSGTPSTVALRGFMINHYIYKKNGNKNVLLLTATPFTNSPLEIFSMLSMVAYAKLEEMRLNSIKTFFDTFIHQTRALVINSRLKPEFKDVILGFNNLISLKSLIRRFILYKTGEEANVKRPKKYVLPLLKEIQNDVYVDLPQESRVETYISMTPQQADMMQGIIDYVEDGTALGFQDEYDEEDEDNDESVEYNVSDLVRVYGDVADKKSGKFRKIRGIISDIIEGEGKPTLYEISKVDSDGFPVESKNSVIGTYEISKIVEEKEEDSEEIDENSLNEDEKLGVRTIKGLNLGRNLALSPHLYKFSGLPNPTYKTYISESPKLTYVMECIRSVKKYHVDKGEPISGQVIFMDRGIKYFSLIKQYLVYELGFKQEEIGIIKSGLKKDGVGSKDYIKNLFNGEIYNEVTQELESVTDDKRIKIVIGSSTIKEGMNLQKYGTVLYNCFIDWNPTDVQQLEGRIYRQGNTFNAVRIVNPLVVDSTDIFIFQKLQEKSSRLNTIWSKDNSQNSLNTEDFNAAELKYALIRDPNVIADLRKLEQVKEVESEVSTFERLRDLSRKASSAAYDILKNYYRQKSKVDGWRNFVETGDKWVDAQKLANLVRDLVKRPNIDIDGKKIIEYWKYKQIRDKNDPKDPISDYSEDTHYNWYPDTYGMSDFLIGERDMKRYMNEFIKAYQIDFKLESYQNDLYKFNQKVEGDINRIKERITFINSEENRKQLVIEAIEQKEAQKISYVGVPQLVNKFSTLNYLLSDKKVSKPKVVEAEVIEVKNVEPRFVEPRFVEPRFVEPKVEIIEEVVEERVTKASAQKLIDTFSKTLRFLSGDDKEFIEKKINTLKKTIRFLND